MCVVDLYREGKQIDFLGVNENYDFEMQGIVNLGSIKTIKPVSFINFFHPRTHLAKDDSTQVSEDAK